MNAFMREFTVAAKESPRIYFAPLVGLIRLIREEIKRLEARYSSSGRA